jgi:hypothetical protein
LFPSSCYGGEDTRGTASGIEAFTAPGRIEEREIREGEEICILSLSRSNSVFTPASFRVSTYSSYINGVLQGTQTQPAVAKGNGSGGGSKNATPLSCKYSFSVSQTDPTTGDVFSFTGSGSVVGFAA